MRHLGDGTCHESGQGRSLRRDVGRDMAPMRGRVADPVAVRTVPGQIPERLSGIDDRPPRRPHQPIGRPTGAPNQPSLYSNALMDAAMP